jgi:hypothetical protein
VSGGSVTWPSSFVHIGLTHLAYCAFAGRDHDLHAVAQRTREILGPGTR